MQLRKSTGVTEMDRELGARLVDLKRDIVAHFNSGHWQELALLTGQSDIILHHPRLLRSLGFGDDDYEGNVVVVLRRIAEADPHAIEQIEDYIDQNFRTVGELGLRVSHSRVSQPRITFAPNVFTVPDQPVESDLVSVMMPFSAEFEPVHKAIQAACEIVGFRCLRASDIWESSVVVQDIFSLVFRSEVVIVDFSNRNPNVMYETGIAHTLGRNVIPISQSIDDVPFDLRHHRVLRYLNNREGRDELTSQLASRLRRFVKPKSAPVTVKDDDDDDVPF
jgi:AbiJ-like protein